MELFKSIGTLSYGDPYIPEGRTELSYKLTVEVDKSISTYYRSLIPKWIECQSQAYDPHISVVRKEIPPNVAAWGKYDGEKLEFSYDGVVHEGTVYFWLNAFSVRLEEIRVELGLPIHSEYTQPPGDFKKCFHITLANKKNRKKHV